MHSISDIIEKIYLQRGKQKNKFSLEILLHEMNSSIYRGEGEFPTFPPQHSLDSTTNYENGKFFTTCCYIVRHENAFRNTTNP